MAANSTPNRDMTSCDHCHQEVERGSMERHLEECDKLDRACEQKADDTCTLVPLSSNESLNQLEKKLGEQQQCLEQKLQEQKQYNYKLQQVHQALIDRARESAKKQQLLLRVLLVLLIVMVVGVYLHSYRVEQESRQNWTEVAKLQEVLQEELLLKDTQIEDLNSTLRRNLNQTGDVSCGYPANITALLQEQLASKDAQIENPKCGLWENLTLTDTDNQRLHTVIGMLQESLQEQVSIKNEQMKELKDTIRVQAEHLNELSARVGHEITFFLFKREKDKAVSKEVYTHLRGHKLNIAVSSDEPREATADAYLSVMVNFSSNGHDCERELPCKFNITLELVNQHRDKDHHTRTLQCVMSRRDELHDCVDRKFIPYSKLEWNEDKQTRYLKNGSLKIRVTNVAFCDLKGNRGTWVLIVIVVAVMAVNVCLCHRAEERERARELERERERVLERQREVERELIERARARERRVRGGKWSLYYHRILS